MFADNKYRFTLQWGTDSEEKHAVGQLLEKLGNKKSEFVIMALTEYLRAHPEAAVPECKISITVQPTQTSAQLMAMVKDMARAAVEELMAGMAIAPESGEPIKHAPSSEELDAMLENLDAFK
ncbi:hypothetical protein SDC9_88018 [bioreactor metagenome]|uniref:Uncharacterized protein n=1 Tax=bioreactor metagenome TaxID=1076179 RepID=A0A644ZRT9_9ZZZZ